MTDKEKTRKEVERLINELIQERGKYYSSDVDDACILELQNVLTYIDSLQEEPVSENMEEAAKHYLYSNILYDDVYVGNPTDKDCIEMFKAGANWQKEHLWKSADGDDLPEYEREVVVFTQIFPDDAEMMMVTIGHRPNPEGWDGKSLSTGKVEHYTPKTYDKGGWNIPNVKYWLDCSIPKEIEL